MTQMPLSNIVDVKISRNNSFPKSMNFNNALLIGDASKINGNPVISKAEGVRTYYDIQSIASDFGVNSEIYKQASIYFMQNPAPTELKIILRSGGGIEAPIVGSYVLGNFLNDYSLEKFKAITDGSFSIIYGGTVYNITNIDLSQINSVKEIKDKINQRIKDVVGDDLALGYHAHGENNRAKLLKVKVKSSTNNAVTVSKNVHAFKFEGQVFLFEKGLTVPKSSGSAVETTLICQKFAYFGMNTEKSRAVTIENLYNGIDFDLSACEFVEYKKNVSRVFYYIFTKVNHQNSPKSIKGLGKATHGTNLLPFLELSKPDIFGTDILQNKPIFYGNKKINVRIFNQYFSVDNVFTVKFGDLENASYETQSIDFSTCDHVLEVLIILSKHISEVVGHKTVKVGYDDTFKASFQFLDDEYNDKIFEIISEKNDIETHFLEHKTMIVSDQDEVRKNAFDLDYFKESPSQALMRATFFDDNFYGVMCGKNLDGSKINDAQIINLSRNIQSLKYKMYFAGVSNLDVSSHSKTCIVSQLNKNNLDKTVVCFNAKLEYFDAEVAGKFLAGEPYKSRVYGSGYTGTSTCDLPASNITNVINKNANIKALYSDLQVVSYGTIASSTKEYADIVRGVDWMKNLLEIELSAYIVNNVIPYNDEGASLIQSKLIGIFKFVESTGFISSDKDENNEIIPSFKIMMPKISQLPKIYKSERKFYCDFEFRTSGSIQKLRLNGEIDQ